MGNILSGKGIPRKHIIALRAAWGAVGDFTKLGAVYSFITMPLLLSATRALRSAPLLGLGLDEQRERHID